MKTSEFDFELPERLIATEPAEPRDSSRLLHVARAGLADRAMRDLPALLLPGDLLVCNDTRVIPAQLNARRGGADIGVTLHKRISGDTWRAFARPARKLRVGDTLDIAAGFSATVTGKEESGIELKFNVSGAEFDHKLAAHGVMPLPPYITRQRAAGMRDRHDYQTIFARKDGAVAAPTAGLHFTEDLLRALTERGVKTASVTLHVGAGTFLPVKTEDVSAHKMHSEWFSVPAETAAAVNLAKAEKRRVVAVGTTSLRVLESAAGDNGKLTPYSGETDIFITPGYRFRIADALLTNFHLPRSTLFMLVCAFSGLERMREAYIHAMERGYRFYSYGDACLLERSET